MTALPVVSRELLAAARRPSTFFVRVAAGTAGLALCLFIVSGATSVNSAQTSHALMMWFSRVVFWYCLLAGLPGTADCLSAEKREGTLGLLFLTDLKGKHVVLGKLAANSINSIYCVVALVPILAITFLLGGVSFWQYAWVFVVAFNLLFLSLSVGLFASSVCVMARRSVGLALVILFVLIVVPGVAGEFGALVLGAPALEALSLLSPFYSLYGSGYVGAIFSVVFTHIYAWLFFRAACHIIPRSWQYRETGVKWAWTVKWTRRFTEGPARVKLAWRRRCLNENAYFWLAAREKHRARLAWFFLGSLALVWLCGWWSADFKDWWLSMEVCIFFGLVTQGFLKIWVAVQASEQFIEDRRSGALELLLSTPLQVREIIAGQRRALAVQFARPLTALVGLELLLVVAGLSRPFQPLFPGKWISLVVLNLILIFVDVWALTWMSMAGAISPRRHGQTAVSAIAIVVFLPWFAGYVAWEFFDFHPLAGGVMSDPAVCFPLFLCVWLDAVFAIGSRNYLSRQFRAAAMLRYTKPKLTST